MAAFDKLDVDSFLQTLSYVHARGLARVACTGRLGAVVSHEAQQCPSLLVLRGTLDEVGRALPERLAARPTVAFVLHGQMGQGQTDESQAQDMLAFVRHRLPPETEVLGACTESLHCLWNRIGAGAKASALTELEACDGDDCVGLLLATLPEARAQAFHIEPSFLRDPRAGGGGTSSSEEDDWSSDDEAAAPIEEEVPPSAPNTADGYTVEAQSTSSAMPATTVESATEPEGAAFLASLPDSAAVSGNDIQATASPLEELLAMDPPPQVVVIHVASNPGRVIDRIQKAFPQAAVVGGVVQGQHVFTRGRSCPEGASGRGVGVLAISGNAPLFAMTCPYGGSRQGAEQDVVRKMQKAQDIALAEEQRILGALLFTCSGRGVGMFRQEAHDARLFQQQFPESPLLGYYAGGEIGPAIQGDAEIPFLKGHARLQGFTAVFGFFLVPRKRAPSALFQRAVLYGEVKESDRKSVV